MPTLDDYFGSAAELARMVRRALDKPGSVKQGPLRAALERFETVDAASRGTRTGVKRR